jgi:hypothetical protein
MAPLRFRPLARFALLAALAHGMCAAGATAQQPTQAQADAIRQSCRGDFQSHCAGVPAGGGAGLRCLQKNLASLSPACQTAVGATEGGAATHPPSAAQGGTTTAPAMPPREMAALMRRSCGGDFRAFCQGVSLGGGRALACLADHQESLSPPCREALASARGR